MTKRMMMIAGLTAIVLASGTGCIGPVKYDLKDAPMARPDSKRQEMRVAVAPLKDKRPPEERTLYGSMRKAVTRDQMFEGGEVARGISEALVTHFNHVQLFKVAEMVDGSAMLPSSDVIEEMKGLGYDALLTGKVTHFHGAGYSTTFDRVAAPMAAVPITIVVTIPIMLIEKNRNEGFVEMVDLQLTDTASGDVLWSGSFSKKMEMKYAGANPTRAACDTLKEVTNEVVKQMESVEIK